MTLGLAAKDPKEARRIRIDLNGSRATVRVLLVDDHALMRIGLVNALSGEPGLTVCGEAATAAKGVEMYRSLRPDVVIMDLRLPDFSGAKATAMIREEFPEARIILISSYAPEDDIYAGFQAGARGYIQKSIDVGDLRAVIYAITRGERHVPSDVAALLAARNPHSELTDRERRVLELVTRGRRNREIAKELAIQEGTVKAHVQTILLKLAVTDRTEAAVVAIQRGIVHL
jgi:DNA-binding NarL/FixJ family response regulator